MPIQLPIDMQVGAIHKTNSSGDLQVIGIKNSYEVLVRFLSTGYETIASAGNIRKGSVKDKNKPSVFGVGYIGDGKFSASSNGKRNHSYRTWTNMLSRCFSDEYKHRQPTYNGCTVAEPWLNYQTFAEWFHAHGDSNGMQLDKDLLVYGNKHYSPETCLLIPQWLNLLTVSRDACRGDCPIGVSFSKRHGKFEAYCNEDAKRVHLGLYDSQDDAHQAWRMHKLYVAEKRKQEMDLIDKRIYKNVVNIINNAK